MSKTVVLLQKAENGRLNIENIIDKVVDIVKTNQIVIFKAPTGMGKSTVFLPYMYY